uniref:Uncharacterized protein n=1 Tax=Oryza rufipogon TaxID=4529 RepID=A0A0E0P7Y2_ORYRU
MGNECGRGCVGAVSGPGLEIAIRKNKEDLVNHDATGPKFIQEFTIQCSKQLFDIYRNKEDMHDRKEHTPSP